MNIYLKELKSYRMALLFWSLGVIAYLLAAMSKFQGYSRSGTSITEIFNSLPAGLRTYFGVNALDLQTAGGFFAGIAILYLSVMLGVHAVLLGSGIISKEETERTIEFLLTKPVSRNRVLFTKLLAALTIIVTLNIITLVSSVITVAAFNEGPSINGDIVFLMPSIFFIQLFFLIIGASFAAIMRRPKRAGMFSAAVLMATYIISAFVDVTDKFGFLKYTTPYQYFDPKTIFSEGRYNLTYITITLAIVTILLVVSRFAYKNRDFYV